MLERTVLEKDLDQGLDQLSLEVSSKQKKLLIDYLLLLVKWNKAYNLTSVRDPRQMIVRHLLDSLVVVPWLSEYSRLKGGNPIDDSTIKHFLDVGTGAGIPGIPLSIMFPDKQFTLLDSNGKKTRFLNQVKIELSRENVDVTKSRIESFVPNHNIDIIFCRAFSSLPNFVNGVEHLITESTELVAMKGVIPEEELALLPSSVKVENIVRLDVPYLEEERHLIILKCQNAA